MIINGHESVGLKHCNYPKVVIVYYKNLSVLITCKNKNEVCTAFACLTVFLFTTKYQQNLRYTHSIQYITINLESPDKYQFINWKQWKGGF